MGRFRVHRLQNRSAGLGIWSGSPKFASARLSLELIPAREKGDTTPTPRPWPVYKPGLGAAVLLVLEVKNLMAAALSVEYAIIRGNARTGQNVLNLAS